MLKELKKNVERIKRGEEGYSNVLTVRSNQLIIENHQKSMLPSIRQ